MIKATVQGSKQPPRVPLKNSGLAMTKDSVTKYLQGVDMFTLALVGEPLMYVSTLQVDGCQLALVHTHEGNVLYGVDDARGKVSIQLPSAVVKTGLAPRAFENTEVAKLAKENRRVEGNPLWVRQALLILTQLIDYSTPVLRSVGYSSTSKKVEIILKDCEGVVLKLSFAKDEKCKMTLKIMSQEEFLTEETVKYVNIERAKVCKPEELKAVLRSLKIVRRF